MISETVNAIIFPQALHMGLILLILLLITLRGLRSDTSSAPVIDGQQVCS